jgi:hypothetical protein
VQAKAARRPVQLATFQALAPLPLVAAGTLAVRCPQLAAALRQAIQVARLVRAAKPPPVLELAVRLAQAVQSAARVEQLPELAAQRAARLEVEQPAPKPPPVREPVDNRARAMTPPAAKP